MTNTRPQTLDEVLDQAQAHFMSALQLAEKAHRQIDNGLLLIDETRQKDKEDKTKQLTG